jgi:CBS domain-containing protein
MRTIAQVMTTRVKSLPATATVGDAIEFLTQHHTGGAPIVDDEGNLVGMISELALIDVVFDAAIKDAPVTKYMTADVQAVQPNETVARAAQLFALYSFRRLPVVEGDRLVGIITRRDLMNHALRTNDFLADPLVGLIPSLVPAGCVEDSLSD